MSKNMFRLDGASLDDWFFTANLSSGLVVGSREYRGGVELLHPEAFLDGAGPEGPYVGGGDLEERRAWLQNSQRRHYSRVTYAPGQAVPDGTFNLWLDLTWKATWDLEDGDPSAFLAALRDDVCQGDPATFELLMDWLAHAVQHPGEWNGTGLVVTNKNQCEYSFFGSLMNLFEGHRCDYSGFKTPRYRSLVLVEPPKHFMWDGRQGREKAIEKINNELDALLDERTVSEQFYQGSAYRRYVIWGDWPASSRFLRVQDADFHPYGLSALRDLLMTRWLA